MVIVEGYFLYKGNEYKVIRQGKMKNPQTREWVNCIIYQRFSNDTSIDNRDWHCRETTDFINKSKKI